MKNKKRRFAELIKKNPIGGVMVVKKLEETKEEMIERELSSLSIMDCELSPSICPLAWDDLEPVVTRDRLDINVRYCKECQKLSENSSIPLIR